MSTASTKPFRLSLTGLALGGLIITGYACSGSLMSSKGDSQSAEPSKAERTAQKPADQMNKATQPSKPAPQATRTVQAAPKSPPRVTQAANKTPPTVEKTSVKQQPSTIKVQPKAILPKASQEPVESIETLKSQMTDDIYATIRVSMEIAIEQRKEFLAAGKKPTDPEIQQLEKVIRNARGYLIGHGEEVDDVVPPLPE